MILQTRQAVTVPPVPGPVQAALGQVTVLLAPPTVANRLRLHHEVPLRNLRERLIRRQKALIDLYLPGKRP